MRRWWITLLGLLAVPAAVGEPLVITPGADPFNEKDHWGVAFQGSSDSQDEWPLESPPFLVCDEDNPTYRVTLRLLVGSRTDELLLRGDDGREATARLNEPGTILSKADNGCASPHFEVIGVHVEHAALYRVDALRLG